MGIGTQPGDVYRLIVVLDARVVEAGDCRFGRFEQAQARVAETVCHYARNECVRAVALQRGRLSRPVDRGGNGRSVRVMLPDDDYDWAIEKHWGAGVIRRILRQRGIEPLAPPRVAAPSEKTAARPASPRTGFSPPTEPHAVGKHRRTRWPLTAALAVIVVALVALILVQTGGHPVRALSAMMDTRPTVKEELPFDARTSFTSEARAETHEQRNEPEDEGSRPDERARP